jgi:hypothetical protein
LLCTIMLERTPRCPKYADLSVVPSRVRIGSLEPLNRVQSFVTSWPSYRRGACDAKLCLEAGKVAPGAG